MIYVYLLTVEVGDHEKFRVSCSYDVTIQEAKKNAVKDNCIIAYLAFLEPHTSEGKKLEAQPTSDPS